MKPITTIFLTGLWINIFEFFRNEFLFKEYWTEHFSSKGLVFETLPHNGVLWLVWGFMLAYLVYKLSEKFSFTETIFFSWLSAFVMMWVTTYNLQVLPLSLLWFAVPLSLIEMWVAAVIVKK